MPGEGQKIWNREIETMDRERLRDLQSKRLSETLRRVYDRVEMYRERMKAAGVKPEDIRSIDDIKYLPFTDKPDLRDQFPYGLFAVDMKDIVRVQGSSGTTGMPIVSGYTQRDVDIWTEMMARTLTAAGAGQEDIIQVAYGYGLFTGGLGAHQGAGALGAMTIPMSSGNTQRQINMMKALGTTILACTPSYAVHIGETIREMGLDIKDFRLKAGVFGAEPWSEEIRKQIESLMNIDALDIYGLTEICGPGAAYECLEKSGMHINEDYVIPEIIDPVTLEPLPYGEKGELVLSTIGKEGMPLFRYRTHDLSRLNPETCACGRTTLRMDRIMGRSDDMLIIRGVNVFPSQIETVLLQTNFVAPHFQIVVDRKGAMDTLEVQVEVTEEVFMDTVAQMAALQREIERKLSDVLNVSASVVLAQPKTLTRFEGKARRVTDKRKI